MQFVCMVIVNSFIFIFFSHLPLPVRFVCVCVCCSHIFSVVATNIRIDFYLNQWLSYERTDTQNPNTMSNNKKKNVIIKRNAMVSRLTQAIWENWIARARLSRSLFGFSVFAVVHQHNLMKTHFNRIQTENCATFHRRLRFFRLRTPIENVRAIYFCKLNVLMIRCILFCSIFFCISLALSRAICVFSSVCARRAQVLPLIWSDKNVPPLELGMEWKWSRVMATRLKIRWFKAAIKVRMVNWYSAKHHLIYPTIVQFFTIHSNWQQIHSHSFWTRMCNAAECDCFVGLSKKKKSSCASFVCRFLSSHSTFFT